MRVLHVDTAAAWRGGQTQLRLLLQHAPGEHHVAIAASGPVGPGLDDLDSTLHRLPLRALFGARAALGERIRWLRPDVIAAHTPKAHRLAVGHGVPVVVHRRVDFAPGPSNSTRRRYHDAHGYIAVSRAVCQVLQETGVPPDRIVVVPDGIDVDAHTPDPERAVDLRQRWGVASDVLLVGALGALVDHKAHDVLVQAMTRLGRDDVVAVIAGEGPLRRPLERQIRRVGAAVQIVGTLDAVDRCGLFGAIEVFVHPSRQEGLGQAVLEAMAAGVPVVATSAGGLSESLGGGARGRMVPPDDPESLAAALDACLRQRHAARDRAESARAWVQAERSAEGMARATMAAYATLLAREAP